MAPITGAKLMQPLTMFEICAASTLGTLYFFIRYTTRLLKAPLEATPTPIIATAETRVTFLSTPTQEHERARDRDRDRDLQGKGR
jgi:hypothetical protein